MLPQGLKARENQPSGPHVDNRQTGPSVGWGRKVRKGGNISSPKDILQGQPKGTVSAPHGPSQCGVSWIPRDASSPVAPDSFTRKMGLDSPPWGTGTGKQGKGRIGQKAWAWRVVGTG